MEVEKIITDGVEIAGEVKENELKEDIKTLDENKGE